MNAATFPRQEPDTRQPRQRVKGVTSLRFRDCRRADLVEEGERPTPVLGRADLIVRDGERHDPRMT